MPDGCGAVLPDLTETHAEATTGRLDGDANKHFPRLPWACPRGSDDWPAKIAALFWAPGLRWARPSGSHGCDLKEPGLLQDTLVIWRGEFGRTPMVQGGKDGRDHHPNCFAMWFAGAGIKPGLTLGNVAYKLLA